MVQKKKAKTTSKTSKGTPTWPTVVKKRSQVDDPSPPLQAARVEGQENSDTCTQVEASGRANASKAKGGCWTKSTSKTARLFQPLSGNTTDGSGDGGGIDNGSRGFSKAASSSSSCSADGESSLITQEEETSNVVKEEMTGLLLGGGREVNSLDTGDVSGSTCCVGGDDDSHSAIVRPQILFRDGDDGCREECNPLGGNEGGCSDPCGKVIESPWDLPNPFMLSVFARLGLDDGSSSTCSASAILREKQQQQQQQYQNGDGPSPPSSSYFSFSTNSPARKNAVVSTCSNTSTGNSKSNQFSDGGFGGIGMMATPTPYHLHNALQHQAHQPLPPEQFRNAHQYHLHLNPVHNGGGIGGEHNNYGGGGPVPPGAPFSSSITSGSPSIGGGSGADGISRSSCRCVALWAASNACIRRPPLPKWWCLWRWWYAEQRRLGTRYVRYWRTALPNPKHSPPLFSIRCLPVRSTSTTMAQFPAKAHSVFIILRVARNSFEGASYHTFISTT